MEAKPSLVRISGSKVTNPCPTRSFIPIVTQVEDIELMNLRTSSALAMVESISAEPVDKQASCSSSTSIL